MRRRGPWGPTGAPPGAPALYYSIVSIAARDAAAAL